MRIKTQKNYLVDSKKAVTAHKPANQSQVNLVKCIFNII